MYLNCLQINTINVDILYERYNIKYNIKASYDGEFI